MGGVESLCGLQLFVVGRLSINFILLLFLSLIAAVSARCVTFLFLFFVCAADDVKIPFGKQPRMNVEMLPSLLGWLPRQLSPCSSPEYIHIPLLRIAPDPQEKERLCAIASAPVATRFGVILSPVLEDRKSPFE